MEESEKKEKKNLEDKLDENSDGEEPEDIEEDEELDVEGDGEISVGKLNLATSNFVKPKIVPEPKKNLENFFEEDKFDVFELPEEVVNSYEINREEEKEDKHHGESERESENFYGVASKSFYDENSLYSESRKDADGEISVGLNTLRRVGNDFYRSGEEKEKEEKKDKDRLGLLVPDSKAYFEGSNSQREYKIY